MKILLVSYNSPPLGGGGVQRVAKFAKYLARQGHEVTLLTASEDSYILYDDSLICDLAGVSVRRVRDRSRTGARNPTIKVSTVRKTAMGLRWLLGWVSKIMPDQHVWWAIKATVVGLPIAKSHDVIVSSARPVSSHLTGAVLSLLSHRRWIADLRDPWWTGAPERQRYIDRRLEAACLRRASVITAAWPSLSAALQVSPTFKRQQIITMVNGVDMEEFREVQPLTERTGLLFGGTIYESRDPTIVLEVLRAARVAGFEEVVVFYGAVHPVHKAAIERAEHDGLICHEGYLRREEYLTRLRSARAALMWEDDLTARENNIPGKLFEYVGAGLPILWLGSKGSVHDLLTTYSNSISVSPSSAMSEMVSAVRKICEYPIRRGSVPPEWDREVQARLLGSLARDLCFE